MVRAEDLVEELKEKIVGHYSSVKNGLGHVSKLDSLINASEKDLKYLLKRVKDFKRMIGHLRAQKKFWRANCKNWQKKYKRLSKKYGSYRAKN